MWLGSSVNDSIHSVKEIRDSTCTRGQFGECQIIEHRKKDKFRKRVVTFLRRTVEQRGYHPIGGVGRW